MAQVERKKASQVERIARLLAQNPGLAAFLVAVAITLLAVCVGGVALAAGNQGIVIEQGAQEGVLEGAEKGGSDESSHDEPAEEPDTAAEPDTPAAPETIVVDVTGAVMAPRVVELPAGSRVNDAIEAAGGLAADADATRINRAAALSDGQQVYVPRVGEDVEVAVSPASPVSPGFSGSGDSGGTPQEGSLVNINTAGVDELDTLPGVGPSTAQAIIDEREANGPFASAEDIMRVSGIGEKKFEKLEGLICVS